MKTSLLMILIAAMVFLTACSTAVTTVDNVPKTGTDSQVMKETAENKEGPVVDEEDGYPAEGEDGPQSATDEGGDIASASFTGNVLAGSTTKYIEFNKADYEKALAENKVILLYFYANWCPICIAEEENTFEAFNELSLDNVVGFRVNYRDSDTEDYEEDLAKKYGISYQHTKVILKDGERVLKAPDSWDKDRYIEEIRRVA